MNIFKRSLGLSGVILGVCSLVAVLSAQQATSTKASGGSVAAPVYRVDPFWPKMPLRNKWLLQGIPTMVTDSKDHIWVLSRPRDIRPDENGAARSEERRVGKEC